MRLRAVLGAVSGLALSAATAHAQSSLLQGGPYQGGRAPMYVTNGQTQPIVQDSGPASGGDPGVGLSELNITSRPGNGVTTPPYANNGTGPNAEHYCVQDAPSTSSTGYHTLCFDANAQGGGLISYQANGSAASLPLGFFINGARYPFPIASGPSFDVVAMGASSSASAATNNQVFQRAFTAAAAVNGAVHIPCQPAPYQLSANIAATVQSKGAIAVNADGQECATLNFTGSNGITITKTDQFGSIFAQNFTLTTTDTTGTYKAFSTVYPNAVVYAPTTGFGQDVITNVFYRGADAYGAGQQYWGIGFDPVNDSYISVYAGGYWGASQSGVNKGMAVSYAGMASVSSYAVVLNLNSFQVQTCDTGLFYGDYVQGVTITGASNFTNCNKGVDTPSSFVGIPDQLVIADSQFSTVTAGVKAPLISELLVHDNVFIVQGGEAIEYGQDLFSIHDNNIHTAPAVAQFIGLNESFGSVVGGEVHHNNIYALATGSEVTSSVTSVNNMHDNNMSSNTVNYLITNNIAGVRISDPGAYVASTIGTAMPTCSLRYYGAQFTVQDQATATFLATVNSSSGGGSGLGIARCNGTNYQFGG